MLRIGPDVIETVWIVDDGVVLDEEVVVPKIEPVERRVIDIDAERDEDRRLQQRNGDVGRGSCGGAAGRNRFGWARRIVRPFPLQPARHVAATVTNPRN